MNKPGDPPTLAEVKLQAKLMGCEFIEQIAAYDIITIMAPPGKYFDSPILGARTIRKSFRTHDTERMMLWMSQLVPMRFTSATFDLPNSDDIS